MITDRDILVCSDAAIQAWERRRSVIPGEITLWAAQKQSEEHRAAQLTPIINTLNGQINNLDCSISNFRTQISALEYQLEMDAIRQREHHEQRQREHKHHGHHHPHHQEFRLVVDVAITLQISNLQSQMRPLEQQRNQLAAERNTVQNTYDAHIRRANEANDHIIQLQEEDAALVHSIKTSHEFLQKLQQTPDQLCRDMINRLQQQIDLHEERYPHNQSISARLALRELPIKLQCILDARIREDGNATREWQLKYAILCSLFWQTANRLAQESDANTQFFHWLRRLMINHVHILAQGDLPDRVGGTGNSCYQLYQTFKVNHANPMRDLTADDLARIELAEYQDAYKTFATTLGPKDAPRVPKQVHKVGTDALKNTEKLRSGEHGTPDLKFYTTALRHLNKTVHEPHDYHLQKCRDLADVAHGAPSCGRIFAGVMLLLAATVLTVGSLVVAAVSLGAATPASVLGIGIGTAAATKAVSILTCGIGIGAIAGACSLFKRRSLSKNLADIAEIPRPWPVQAAPVEATAKPVCEPSAPPGGLVFR